MNKLLQSVANIEKMLDFYGGIQEYLEGSYQCQVR